VICSGFSERPCAASRPAALICSGFSERPSRHPILRQAKTEYAELQQFFARIRKMNGDYENFKLRGRKEMRIMLAAK